MNKTGDSREQTLLVWKCAAVNLIWIAAFSVLSVFLTSVVFAVAFKQVLDGIELSGGKAAVQLFLEGASYALFLLTVSLSAFLRGKRRSKRPKPSKDVFLRGVFLAMAIAVLPALLLFHLTDPSANRTLLFLYMPFVCLTDGLGFTQLSVMLTAFVAAGSQYLTYWLGSALRRRRDERE